MALVLKISSRFDEIYDSTNKAILAYITAKCGRTADVGDIFQDTYMELYNVLLKHGAEYIEHEKAFVAKIAKRKIAKYYSLAERLKIFVSMTAFNSGGDEIDLSDFRADNFLAEDFTQNHALLDEAMRLIGEKPEDVQKIFYLTYNIGLTISEIADALSMRESNVKNKLYRTLRELRVLMKGGNQQ